MNEPQVQLEEVLQEDLIHYAEIKRRIPIHCFLSKIPYTFINHYNEKENEKQTHTKKEKQ